MNQREQFEAWAQNAAILEDDHGEVNLRFLGLHDAYIDGTVNMAYRIWQASRQATIQSIQEARTDAVLLPGAIVLPGDFFSKAK